MYDFFLYTFMHAVEPLNMFFNPVDINNDVERLIFADDAFDLKKFSWHNQASLRQSDDWFAGTGSLYDYNAQQFVGSTASYTQTSEKLAGSYLEMMIKFVEGHAAEEGVKIGRVRLMRLLPKTCYTLHTDLEEFRYHIPVQTNNSNFFVIDNNVYRMPTAGQLYRFKTNAAHTAVNASTEPRTHIVFDTFT